GLRFARRAPVEWFPEVLVRQCTPNRQPKQCIRVRALAHDLGGHRIGFALLLPPQRHVEDLHQLREASKEPREEDGRPMLAFAEPFIECNPGRRRTPEDVGLVRSEEHTSELQSLAYL